VLGFTLSFLYSHVVSLGWSICYGWQWASHEEKVHVSMLLLCFFMFLIVVIQRSWRLNILWTIYPIISI
jgi:hypothetical protein